MLGKGQKYMNNKDCPPFFFKNPSTLTHKFKNLIQRKYFFTIIYNNENTNIL